MSTVAVKLPPLMSIIALSRHIGMSTRNVRRIIEQLDIKVTKIRHKHFVRGVDAEWLRLNYKPAQHAGRRKGSAFPGGIYD